jgi:hypothetical protein
LTSTSVRFAGPPILQIKDSSNLALQLSRLLVAGTLIVLPSLFNLWRLHEGALYVVVLHLLFTLYRYFVRIELCCCI